MLQEGAVKVFLESGQHDELSSQNNQLEAVQENVHIETITGNDLDEVVDIFTWKQIYKTEADLAMEQRP